MRTWISESRRGPIAAASDVPLSNASCVPPVAPALPATTAASRSSTCLREVSNAPSLPLRSCCSVPSFVFWNAVWKPASIAEPLLESTPLSTASWIFVASEVPCAPSKSPAWPAVSTSSGSLFTNASIK